jgi:hypothetical protein
MMGVRFIGPISRQPYVDDNCRLRQLMPEYSFGERPQWACVKLRRGRGKNGDDSNSRSRSMVSTASRIDDRRNIGGLRRGQ